MKDKLLEIANQLTDRANNTEYEGDIDDIGNTIGIIVGNLHPNMTKEDTEDFIFGIKHGISLTNGTHGQ